jgi:hypothetical protein
MNVELERVLKRAVVAYIHLLFGNFYCGTEENHEIPHSG